MNVNNKKLTRSQQKRISNQSVSLIQLFYELGYTFEFRNGKAVTWSFEKNRR
jgi:hypothetical protein